MIGCHCPAPPGDGSAREERCASAQKNLSMALPGEVVLRQRTCCRSECCTVFWICQHCDRGQRYCSPACRTAARLQQRRSAKRPASAQSGGPTGPIGTGSGSIGDLRNTFSRLVSRPGQLRRATSSSVAPGLPPVSNYSSLPSSFKSALLTNSRSARFISNTVTVALPIAVLPRIWAPSAVKCSAQLSVRGLNKRTI